MKRPGPSRRTHRRELQQTLLYHEQRQTERLTKENKSLQHSVNIITTQLTSVIAENKTMKETILDLQARSMKDKLVFTCIPEQPTDDPEKTVKDFMTKQLKLPAETINNMTWEEPFGIC